ncbi:hypothetical protein H6F88_04860 [Oculatella sp. FACHB-28]|uniref:hypothetical protein n=1 Tax=Cyanophyceae TaxID=3028117 RepID=UPI001687F36D|nr:MULTISPECIES: hypothetical protein [Cyanophyceae]MBD1997339.1 hypothetical protein [Leptolyngbya sp. FACHB-541]MBD2055358.1 hypothetical protein [Oculatella sp. FACHB-28]
MVHSSESLLPAVKVDRQGKRCLDYRAILALSLPLFLNSSVQAILNLTDSWFIGRLSTDAIAAMGALYFLILVLFTAVSQRPANGKVSRTKLSFLPCDVYSFLV